MTEVRVFTVLLPPAAAGGDGLWCNVVTNCIISSFWKVGLDRDQVQTVLHMPKPSHEDYINTRFEPTPLWQTIPKVSEEQPFIPFNFNPIISRLKTLPREPITYQSSRKLPGELANLL